MRPQLLFGAVMSITNSLWYRRRHHGAVRLSEHRTMRRIRSCIIWRITGQSGFQMGYACAIATVLFVMMVGVNLLVQKLIAR